MFKKKLQTQSTGGYHPKRTSGWGIVVGTGMALVLGAMLMFASSRGANTVYANMCDFNPVVQEMIQLAVADEDCTCPLCSFQLLPY